MSFGDDEPPGTFDLCPPPHGAVLNRHDDCCFGEAQHSIPQTGMSRDQAMRRTESDVRRALLNLGANGSFRLEIDETAPVHMISHHAVNVILSELNGLSAP